MASGAAGEGASGAAVGGASASGSPSVVSVPLGGEAAPLVSLGGRSPSAPAFFDGATSSRVSSGRRGRRPPCGPSAFASERESALGGAAADGARGVVEGSDVLRSGEVSIADRNAFDF